MPNQIIPAAKSVCQSKSQNGHKILSPLLQGTNKDGGTWAAVKVLDDFWQDDSIWQCDSVCYQWYHKYQPTYDPPIASVRNWMARLSRHLWKAIILYRPIGWRINDTKGKMSILISVCRWISSKNIFLDQHNNGYRNWLSSGCGCKPSTSHR